jgi:phage FluMu protein Com
MNEIRCRCGRLLAKAIYISIEIKCPRCKTLNRLKIEESQTPAPRVPDKDNTRGATTNQKPNTG